MQDFISLMQNNLFFSECETPSKPSYPAGPETIIVEKIGDILIVSDCDRVTRFKNNSIYADLISSNAGTLKFKLRETVPQGMKEFMLFAALESYPSSAELKLENGKRKLTLYGVDDGNGRETCRGWVFDATE